MNTVATKKLSVCASAIQYWISTEIKALFLKYEFGRMAHLENRLINSLLLNMSFLNVF
ncbi:hypothetical protein Q7371_03600 [Glaesserella parasuis]|nr:hypothetical protein [Glaesserella parasuis]